MIGVDVPVYLLGSDLVFPPPRLANEDGVVAVGGDCSPERLLLAYRHGIFPWPVEGFPLLWFSPDPRCVLPPDEVHVARSLRKELRKTSLRVTTDQAFGRVIDLCAAVARPGQTGTWITPELREGYVELHARGFAHSVEAWDGEDLVGGLYGVSLGAGFFGESMFARVANASKVAFVTLLAQLTQWGFELVDCQVKTAHLERFGAREVPRDDFLAQLPQLLEAPTRRGSWEIEVTPATSLAILDEARSRVLSRT